MLSRRRTCRTFTLAEVRFATNNFESVIGHGGFGDVYLGRIESKEVAVKRLDFGSSQGQAEFKTEIDIVFEVRHCRLVSMIGYCEEEGEMILVYEYMPLGSLHDNLHKDCGRALLTWESRLKICVDAADGLHYLHEGIGFDKRILHGDIKSANILLDKNFEAKISDFGLSTVAPANTGMSYVIQKTLKFSRDYVDPQYLKDGILTKEADVYSFGMVMLEVLCGKKAFSQHVRDGIKQGRLEGSIDNIIDQNLKGKISEKCIGEFIGIALQCLHKRYSERPLISEVGTDLRRLLRSISQTSTSQKIYPPDSTVIRHEFSDDNGRGYDIADSEQLVEISESEELSLSEQLSKVSRAEESSFSSYNSPSSLLNQNIEPSMEENSNRKICYSVAVAEVVEVNEDTFSPRECWELVPESESSRQPVVAKLLPTGWLEVKHIMTTQVLSPETFYEGYIVFKLMEDSYGFDFPVKNVALEYVWQDEVVQNSELVGNTYFKPQRWRSGGLGPQLRTDGWFEIKIGEFYNYEDGALQMSLELSCSRNLKMSGLIVKGFEFRTKEIGTDILSGGVYKTIAGKKLTLVNDYNDRYQKSTLTEPSFLEVVEILPQDDFRFHCKISPGRVLPKQALGVYVVFKLTDYSTGFDGPIRTELKYITDQDGNWSSHTNNSILLKLPRVKPDGCQLPQIRKDGWMEIDIGFIFHTDPGVEVEIELTEWTSEIVKSGLIVKGVEFRIKADA